MASGVLLLNDSGELLMVEPCYKPTWEIPGGVVENGESPQSAAIREVQEELQLKLVPEELNRVTLEYMGGSESKTEALMFIFSGGVLSAEQQQQIVLPPDELRSYRFVALEKLPTVCPPVLMRRVLAGYHALQRGTFSYLEGAYT
jgi:8-oxo-dGTP pyrophosphatase MutT (NUDIX family)